MTTQATSTAPQDPGQTPKKRKGVFDPRQVRFMSFAVIIVALFATAVLCILAIWDYTTKDTAWRALSTLGVITGTMLIFTFINETIGPKMDV
jgi:hypothetical protein